MTNTIDPQRKEELSKQQGYGETPDDSSIDASQPAPGFRRTNSSIKAMPDRGAFRDDGDVPSQKTDEETLDRQTDIVVDPEDNRTNNVPDTYGADHGEKPNVPAGDDPRPEDPSDGEQLLEDAYSVNDAGVKTKK